MNKIVLILLVLVAAACQKNGPKKSGVPEWTVAVEHFEPKSADAGWTRVIQVHGDRCAQVFVDKQIKGSDAWQQIGLTDDQCKFEDKKIDEDACYRIGGVTTTPWYHATRTIIITSAAGIPAGIEGDRCVIPERVTIYIGNQNLELKCHEILVQGNIFSFAAPATVPHASGLNAGDLTLTADIIDVSGYIRLRGQVGAPGARPGTAEWSSRVWTEIGGTGGNGGKITLNYSQLNENQHSFDIEGGEPGPTIQHKNDYGTQQPDGQIGLRGSIVRNKLPPN